MNWSAVKTIAQTDLKQLANARDFWLPMVILGSIFFVVAPTILLLALSTIGENETIAQISGAIDALPEIAKDKIQGESEAGRASFALAVFLFAPMAIVVPLTISTAVGATTIVGERERGTGEFLAHSPAGTREIYLGKLVASIVPGYLTTLVGFTIYSLIVNIIAGPQVGRWFFPTFEWWILMLWVVPPFLALTLSLILRLSAKVQSTAAAQQASGLVTLPLIGIAYSQSTGALFGGTSTSLIVGLVAWLIAGLSLVRGISSIKRGRLLGVADGI